MLFPHTLYNVHYVKLICGYQQDIHRRIVRFGLIHRNCGRILRKSVDNFWELGKWARPDADSNPIEYMYRMVLFDRT